MRIRYSLMTAVATVGLVCAWSAPAQATTTSVFYDGHSNLAATNNPFPDVQPSALDNMAAGIDALTPLTTGIGNTGVGAFALGGTNTGGFNTALGRFAGVDVTSASDTTAVGAGALLASNADGATAVGRAALG